MANMMTDLATHRPVHSGTHVPRIVTIPADIKTAILGGASHQAWVECVKEGKTKPGSATKVPNAVHKARTRDIAQAAFKEYIMSQL